VAGVVRLFGLMDAVWGELVSFGARCVGSYVGQL